MSPTSSQHVAQEEIKITKRLELNKETDKRKKNMLEVSEGNSTATNSLW